MTQQTLRATLKTKDGSIIMNRAIEPWVLEDKIFAKQTMEIDARLKGVKIVDDINFSKAGIAAVAEWLK